MKLDRTSASLLLLAIGFASACGSNESGPPDTGGTGGSTSASGGSAGRAGSGGTTAQTGGTSATAGSGSSVGGSGVGGASSGGSTAAGTGGTQNTAGSTSGSGGTSSNTGGSGAANTAGESGSGGLATGGAGAANGGAGGGSAGAGTAGGTGGSVACNPADMTPEATPIDGVGRGSPPAGEFDVVVENDPGISDQTIFRPSEVGSIQHPILAWGNGACSKNISSFGELLVQFAAEGIVVVGDGNPGASGSSEQDGAQLIAAIDWLEQENARPCSKYYQKLDLTKVAVAGQSCGGLMALNASDDPRVSVSMPMNSGLLQRNQTLYDALHAPMAIIDGGPDDIAYENGQNDFDAIDSIPLLFANLPVGHGGTYSADNAGDFGEFAVAWLRWHLFSDMAATGKGMFIGDSCGFCGTEWDMQWKNKPE